MHDDQVPVCMDKKYLRGFQNLWRAQDVYVGLLLELWVLDIVGV